MNNGQVYNQFLCPNQNKWIGFMRTKQGLKSPFKYLTLAPIVIQSRRRYSDFYQLKTPSLLPLSFNSEKDQRGDHQTL